MTMFVITYNAMAFKNNRQPDCLFNSLLKLRIEWNKYYRSTLLGLCEGDPQVTGGFLYKGPVMRKAFSWHDIVMYIIQVPWRWVMALPSVNSWVILSRFKQWPSARMIVFSSQVNIAKYNLRKYILKYHQRALLLTWFNVNHGIDKLLHAQ